jgi:selenide,water dikinase
MTEEMQLLRADAITSGGLLISVPAEKADRLADGLKERQTLAAAVVGEVIEDKNSKIYVLE